MEESRIIKTIKILGEIKPSKEWVNDLEFKIAGKKPTNRLFDFPTFPTLSTKIKMAVLVLGGFFQKPFLPALPALAKLAIIVIMTLGAFLGITNIPRSSPVPVIVDPSDPKEIDGVNYYLAMAEKDLEQVKTEIAISQEKPINHERIQQINKTIQTASQKIPKRVKDAKEAALIVERVVSINQKAKEVRAALIDVEIDTENLTYQTTQMVEDRIKSAVAELLVLFEKTSMNDAQKALFENAKKSFNAGRYEESLEIILRMTSNN